ncbi:MAG: hypothetical protein R3Y50_11000 [Rikenellaceae bacterium]
MFNSTEMDIVKLNGEVVFEKSPYEEFDYIESNSAQYIDTGIYPNNGTMTITLKVSINYAPNGYRGLCGARNAQTVSSQSACIWVYGSYLRLDWLGINNILFDYTPGATYTIELSDDKVTINDEVFTNSNSNILPLEYTFLIGNINDNGAESSLGGANMSIYYCKIEQENLVLAEFVPAKLTRNVVNGTIGEVGLWDKVTNTFFGNQGTGAFEAYSL